ncbi:MAG: ornithine cyclodeaminase family protein [Nitrososphaerales archaeon]
MVLILDENDVASVIDIRSTIERMESAFQELGRGKVIMPKRSRMSIPDSFGTIRLMPAALLDSKISGLKVLAGSAGHRKLGQNYFLILLHDYEDGALQCIMSANRLTQLRTGALSAVATKHLASKNSKTIGLIGAGVQGKGQLEAIHFAMHLKGGWIYDTNRDNASRLAEFAKKNLGIDMTVVNTLDAAIEGSDIVVTTTTSSDPFLNLSMVRKGTHINAIGSNLPNRKELDTSILTGAKIIVDSREQAIEESGDFEPIRKHILQENIIHAELSEVLAGTKPGRTNDSEITVFKSVGVALQDIITARLLYERAIEKNIGRQINL